MKDTTIWNKVLPRAADPQRARHYLGLLSETTAAATLKKASLPQAQILSAVFSGSQALSSLLVARPDWLEVILPERLEFGRRKQGLQQELEKSTQPLLDKGDFAGALNLVREFKSREMLRIGARDLAHVAPVTEIIREISDVADVCLETVWQVCSRQLVERYGKPYHQDTAGQWRPTTACVLGMGKLGGQELNYSSDVDVLFVYSEEGSVFKDPPGKKDAFHRVPGQTVKGKTASKSSQPKSESKPTLANHQFFNRLAEAFIAEISRLGSHGAMFRIDLRLRPEGDAGPLTRSISGYENYYAQWGQTWERMMLTKARGVAGDQALAAEFLETVQPFRYPRSINENVLFEVGAMKDRIENEVVRADELDRNVKLGRGGIREIEFVVQSLQLLHAGRQPFLQGSQTLPGLEKLAQYELLSMAAARELRDAYCFLRDVEHRLQMENGQQTHTIPADSAAQQRLARLMDFPDREAFETARRLHTERVRTLFDSVLRSVGTTSTSSHSPAQKDQGRGGTRPYQTSDIPREFEGAEQEWKNLLQAHGFKDLDRAFRVLREFVEGPGYVHVSSRTRELAFRLLPRIFDCCPGGKDACHRVPNQSVKSGTTWKSSLPPTLSDPDRVVTRLDNFISAYGARSTLFELWNSNPAIFDLLVLLFDRSEFLAELAIRSPDLVDELVTSGRLRQRKTAEQTLRDLRHGLSDDDQRLWLRRYHQAEVMRIGLRDILGLADFEQYLIELSSLADACLRYALESAMRRHRVKSAPFVIIGLGKLGGAEIDYGSDLDLLFVADSKAKSLAKLKELALEIMDLLSSRTEQGLLFHTDARLRPDGEKGLLVNTLTAYEEYYRRRAMLWEIQSLTRTRPIAGDLKLGQKFQSLAATLTNFARPSEPLAAYVPDWKSKIHQMRMRIEKERTPRGKEELAIKTGAGGLMDAEFVAQTLCLEHGWQQANTLQALLQGRQARFLSHSDKLIENYRQLRRIEGILRRWSYEGETVLPDDPEPYYRVSIRCGFASPEQFREALRACRRGIREVYNQIFDS